nr:hypothetical protein [Tanacetum cinerariifolium]
PRVQHPSERARAGYASSVCLHHRSAVSISNKGNGNDEVGSGIGNSGGVPIGGILNRGARINVDGAADLIRTIDALVQGSIIGGCNGSGVNIGNGIRNGGNGYDVGKTKDSGGVGDTATGSGCSSAGSTSSAGGRYSRYSGPGRGERFCMIGLVKVLYDWVSSASVLVRFSIKSSVELARGRGRGVIDDVDNDGEPCCVLETFDNNARGSTDMPRQSVFIIDLLSL